MKQFVLALGLVLAASTAYAQTPPVKNPTAIQFTSADHNLTAVTGYEVDIVRSDAVVLQTLQVAKTSTTTLPDGSIRVPLNVQPIAFGTYTVVVRTVAGAIKSDSSVPSDPWERVPGRPGKPTVQ